MITKNTPSERFQSAGEIASESNRNVDHPSHYGGKDNLYETIKVIEAWELNFHLGNVIKYVSRAGKKKADSVEDLKKANFYLERYISMLEDGDSK